MAAAPNVFSSGTTSNGESGGHSANAPISRTSSVQTQPTRQRAADPALESALKASVKADAGRPADVRIAMKDLEAASLPREFDKGFQPAPWGSYMLTPQATMPVLSVVDPAASPERRSSSTHGTARFSSQRYAEMFGTKRWAADKAHVHNPPVNNNQGAYDKFRTRSTRFDRPQTSRANSVRQGSGGIAEGGPRCSDDGDDEDTDASVKPGRYFDALSGPELDELRDHEVLMLPRDELWPFLLRFPIGCFGVCLGLGSQAILWKQLSLSQELRFLHIPGAINLFLWCLALLALAVIAATYALKLILYFEAVRREFFHPVRVNFFFAPWIAAMFLSLGVPPSVAATVHPAVFCAFMAPVLALELKIYGQWLSGGQRRLSKVANPSTHLSVVGNFVGALLAAVAGWTEPAIFFWAVGLAHYLVLFVTLYQRLPTNESLPKDLHPVFFLFVAAPSAASVAWMHISGRFDVVSRLVFFIALFLYSSLVVRINFFRGIRFSLSWWAYTFPMTAAAIASINYAHAATSWITRGLAMLLSFISSATVLTLFCSTLLHAFVWKSLFPNDIAIAITARGHRPKRGAGKERDAAFLTLEKEPLHKVMFGAIQNLISKDTPPADEELVNAAAPTPDSSASHHDSENGIAQKFNV